MISAQTPEASLSNLLRRLALAPNDQALTSTFNQLKDQFHHPFPFDKIIMNEELTRRYLLVNHRIQLMTNVPEQLQCLMNRVEDCVNNGLQINPVLAWHLNRIDPKGIFNSSCIDNMISSVNTLASALAFNDLFILLGGDWGTNSGSGVESLTPEPLRTIQKVYALLILAADYKAIPQSDLWIKSGLIEKCTCLAIALDGKQEKSSPVIDFEALTLLKSNRETIYKPIGYAIDIKHFFIHLIAIDYSESGYQLRLLTTDHTPILAIGYKADYYCPEVIWEDLTIEQLLDPDIWSPLEEARNLSLDDITPIGGNTDSVLAFNASHIVPYLIRKLKKHPKNARIEVAEHYWTATLKNKYRPHRRVVHDLKERASSEPPKNRELLLLHTGKEIKDSIFKNPLAKFINLLSFDTLSNYNDRLLFKAQSRLLMLVSAFKTLQNRSSSLHLRGNFIKLVEQSYGKITSPIEKLMQNNAGAEQIECGRILLVSLLDLKHRFNNVIHTLDTIPPVYTRTLFPTVPQVLHLDFSQVHRNPVEQSILNILRLNEGIPPLPQVRTWNEQRFPTLYASLERWYSLLLDAKKKCEPAEIITMAHRNIFSRLPIPSTNNVENTFPDNISEGLQVGTLILIKKICSLVSAEAYSEPFISPIFIADMARAFRFSVELLRQINPVVRKMTVSWYFLSRYVESRHSYLASGEVKRTLESLVASFKVISPNGHLRPSDDFEEIPLFYFSWDEFPTTFQFHRKALGPFQINPRTVDAVLSKAELADSMGLTPEETATTYRREASIERWINSFGGQSILLLEQLSQYCHMSVFASTDAYRIGHRNLSTLSTILVETLGPEDHFQLVPPISLELTGYKNRFGGYQEQFAKQVIEGEIPASQRMTSILSKKICEPITALPVTTVEEWRAQAQLLKSLPKNDPNIGTYYLHQIASGPSELSIDVLLEYFEQRSSLLLNSDYRAYFSGIVRSASILENALRKELRLLKRIRSFIHSLQQENRQKIYENTLHLDRLLWAFTITRNLCTINNYVEQKLTSTIIAFADILYNYSKQFPLDARIAPHLIACQHLLPVDFKLSLPEMARLHLLVGRCPPTDPNEASLWLEVSNAMQGYAPTIQKAMLNGDENTRRALWELILSTEAEIDDVMNRPPLQMDLGAIAETSTQLELVKYKQTYLERWAKKLTKDSNREDVWREEATKKMFLKGIEESNLRLPILLNDINRLHLDAKNLLCVSSTSLLVQIADRIIVVDWETGRTTGGGHNLPLGSRLPVHLRKHPDLAHFGQILHRPVIHIPESGKLQFKDITTLSIDPVSGEAWLIHDSLEYRLISNSQSHSLKLPFILLERFSIWFHQSEEGISQGLITAHQKDGTPVPVFGIDSYHRIYPLTGNTQLRLANQNYYPEAQLFSRWGIPQSLMLVWLDPHGDVTELYLPLNNGQSGFTRVIRSGQDEWMIDGLDITLEATHESIPPFVGHPIYLVGKNLEAQRILLLPGATPYEIQTRKLNQSLTVDWNEIFTSGSTEGIHQYRIMPSGQIEGLTVIDNLLLMLWTLYMGHYSATMELAKRWLTPPGRTYTEAEEKILMNWIPYSFKREEVRQEKHPSALAIRLYVLLRLKRHIRDYPPDKTDSGKKSKLWKALASTKHQHTYYSRLYTDKELFHRGVFRHQSRNAGFDELISIYDHEEALRYTKNEQFYTQGTHFVRNLYNRLNGIHDDQQQKATLLTCSIEGSEIISTEKIPDYGELILKELIRIYPTTVQNRSVPTELIHRQLIPTPLISFFDHAYQLIQMNDQHDPEWIALEYAFKELHGEKMLNLCLLYESKDETFFSERNFEKNILLWLILEQAFQLKMKGRSLPDLPSVNRRFGLVLKGSTDSTTAFFSAIFSLAKTTAQQLLSNYSAKWFAKREIRYLEQHEYYPDLPTSFTDILKAPWSGLLLAEISRWSQLNSPLSPQVPELYVEVSWSNSTPVEWAEIPHTFQGLTFLEQELNSRLAIISNERRVREKELLLNANALPAYGHQQLAEIARQIHYVSPRSLDECIGFALINKISVWKKNCPETDPHVLQRSALNFLEIALEEDHFLRMKSLIQKCLNNPLDNDLRDELQESIRTTHQYPANSSTLPLMVAEYYSKCRLRMLPDQAHLIKLITAESTHCQGSVIQAIMGSGKSKMLAPIWLQIMLGTGRIPILCVPNSLFRTTLSDLQNMMWIRFRTHVRALMFDRESCTKDKLLSLAESLYLSRQEPTVFVCSPRDLHALQLMLKERHQVIEDMRKRLVDYTLTWAKQNTTLLVFFSFKKSLTAGRWDEAKNLLPSSTKDRFNNWYRSHEKLEEELAPLLYEATILQSILNLLQQEAALLVDEVATAYDPRNLLSFPIGWQERANPFAASMACKLYFEWLPDYFGELDFLNNMQGFSSEPIRAKIYIELAKRARAEFCRLLPDIRFPSPEIFTAYLLSNEDMGKPMLSFIEKLNQNRSMIFKQAAQEIAFLKYSLSTGLEGALTSTAHVNYGRSKQNPNLHLAIPYECANVPKENTLFRIPWKTVLMTCQYYSQGWLDPNQTVDLLGFLRGIDPTSKDRTLLAAANQIWGSVFANVDFSDIETIKQLTTSLDRARLHPDMSGAARLLIQTYLQSCVFPTQLKLDPAQLTSTPQDLPMVAAKSDAMGGTFGFESTWNLRLTRIPDRSSDQSILKALAEPRNQFCHIIPKGGAESLLAEFETGALNGYMALIDAGALFKGITNETVSRRLLASLQTFDCILFYDEAQQGGARLAVMCASGKVVLENYDKEGVRRALTQLKLSSPFAYYDQARRIGADLDLPSGRALLTFSGLVTLDDVLQSSMRCRYLLDGRHSITYAIPGEMNGELSDDWNGDRVLQIARTYQRQLEEKANFHGICEQLRGKVRAYIDRAIRSTTDSNERHRLYTRAQEFLMEKQSNDLVKTFSSLKGTIRSQQALEALIQQLVKLIDHIFPDSGEKMKCDLYNVLAWHIKNNTPIPEWVRDGEEQEDAVQEVDLSKDQDRLRLMEEEYERMLGTRNPTEEVAWTYFNRRLIQPVPIGLISNEGRMPSLYTLKSALLERGFDVPFADNLLISSNLLTTFLGETNCLLTENQKPVHRCLFVKQKAKSMLVLVSEGDARSLKSLLIQEKASGVYLLEPSGIINQRSVKNEPIHNLWKEGSIADRTLLLQAILFQGSALVLDHLPKDEVTTILRLIYNNDLKNLTAIRVLFESALNFRSDDMTHYRRNASLRSLFANNIAKRSVRNYQSPNDKRNPKASKVGSSLK